MTETTTMSETTLTTTLTIDGYLAALPSDRRDAITRLRDAINAKVPRGYEEKLQYGMIAWCVPESVLAAKDVYNGQPLCLACLGSQKSHMAVYLMGIYGDEAERAWFERAYKASGKKLDMGKSCVRFSSIDKLAVDVVAEAMSRIPVERYVESYHKVRAAAKAGAKPAETSAKGKPGAKGAAAKPAAKPVAAKPAAKPVAAKPAAKAVVTKPTPAKSTAKAPASNSGKTIASKPIAKKPASTSRSAR
jgi:hypothetical protein